MSEPVERFALARRGLPLPMASHATLKGGWLPAAARNRRAPEPIRATTPVPPPAPELPLNDEPWWMEASELVPVGAETTTSVSAPNTATARASSVSPQSALSESPTAAADNRQPAPVASPSQSNDTPEREASAPSTERAPVKSSPNAPVPTMTTRMREAAEPPTARPLAHASEPTSVSGPHGTMEPHVARERDDRPLPRTASAPAPNVSVLALGAVESPNPQERAPSSGPSVSRVAGAAPMQPRAVESTTVERIIERMRTETPKAPLASIAPVRVDIMGSSSPGTMSRTPATADLSSLLAPVKHTAGDIRIDRVAVTVQTPARQAQSAASAPHAAPTASPPARAYRNPWASYFARRD